jgi:hypothetical protein
MAREHDFLDVSGEKWIDVHSFDDRGDPDPPNNFRPEHNLAPAHWTGTPCYRVDKAWEIAHSWAKKYGLTQTDYGRRHEDNCKEWVKEWRGEFGIKPW